jgi:hypothetical protein
MYVGDVGSLILTTPVIRKEWQYVVVSVFKMEGLPVMDGKVIQASYISTYIHICCRDYMLYVCMYVCMYFKSGPIHERCKNWRLLPAFLCWREGSEIESGKSMYMVVHAHVWSGYHHMYIPNTRWLWKEKPVCKSTRSSILRCGIQFRFPLWPSRSNSGAGYTEYDS